MKSKYLMGISVIALGLAMSPAAFADPIDVNDTLNGNGFGNDTQTDIDGDATNSPQTGDDNFRGDVLSGNEIDVTVDNDNDGNGALNDTFDNVTDATNTPQTGDDNVRGNVGSNNEIEVVLESDQDGNGALNDTFQNDGEATNTPQTGDFNVRGDLTSRDIDESAVSEGNAANGEGSIDNVDANGGSIAINDAGYESGEGVNIAGGSIAEESIDHNTASGNGVILNDVGFDEGNGANIAAGDIADGEDASIERLEMGDGSAYAEGDSAAVVVGDVDVLFDTDAVASNTEMGAANVLNVAAANLAIADEDAEASLSASAEIGGTATDVSLGQFSANSGSQGITEQSQTVTANIGTGSF